MSAPNSLIEQEVAAGGGLSPAQTAKRFPSIKSRDDETRVNPSTVWRWITRGLKLPDGRRVKLEAVRMGASYLTSEQAILRFIQAQQRDADPIVPPRTHKQRTRSAARAGAELERLGA